MMNAYMGLARFYDDLTGDVPYESFANYYENIFRQRGKQVKTLLDFACGTGTLTCIMAQRGYEMIAVDPSPDMLMELMDKAYTMEDVEPPLVLCQDAVSLDLNDVVDACYSSLDGINYIHPEDLTELFRLLHLFIAPDGLLVFDVNSPARSALWTGRFSWTKPRTCCACGARTLTKRKTRWCTAWICSPVPRMICGSAR